MADFHEGLCAVLNDTLKQATAEIEKLRADNKALRAELKDRDPQLWEMAEQICALQLQVESLTPCKHGIDSRNCGLCEDEKKGAVLDSTKAADV